MERVFDALYWGVGAIIFALAVGYFILMNQSMEIQYRYICHNNRCAEISEMIVK